MIRHMICSCSWGGGAGASREEAPQGSDMLHMLQGGPMCSGLRQPDAFLLVVRHYTQDETPLKRNFTAVGLFHTRGAHRGILFEAFDSKSLALFGSACTDKKKNDDCDLFKRLPPERERAAVPAGPRCLRPFRASLLHCCRSDTNITILNQDWTKQTSSILVSSFPSQVSKGVEGVLPVPPNATTGSEASPLRYGATCAWMPWLVKT